MKLWKNSQWMFLLTTNKKIWNKETVRYLVTGRKKLPVMLDEGDRGPGALHPNSEPAVSDERAPLLGPLHSVACKNWENVLGGAEKSSVHHHILLPQASGCSETLTILSRDTKVRSCRPKWPSVMIPHERPNCLVFVWKAFLKQQLFIFYLPY